LFVKREALVRCASRLGSGCERIDTNTTLHPNLP
jgi:hypothetical protein